MNTRKLTAADVLIKRFDFVNHRGEGVAEVKLTNLATCRTTIYFPADCEDDDAILAVALPKLEVALNYQLKRLKPFMVMDGSPLERIESAVRELKGGRV